MAAGSIKTPPLPDGFQLENKANDELPPLPKGFQLEEHKQESPEKGALRAATQIPLGIAEGTNIGLGGSLLNLIGTGEALAEFDELEERLPELKKKFPQLNWPDKIDKEKYMEAVQTASDYNPLTIGGLSQITEDLTGAPLTPKTKGQRQLRFAGTAGKLKTGSLGKKTAAGVTAPAVSAFLQKQGLSEGASDIAGLLLTQLRGPKKNKSPKIKDEKLISPNGPARSSQIETAVREVEKMPSGLTKLKIVEEKLPKLAQISPERQKQVITNLNQEASKLTKSSIEKHLPISKKIEGGFDFEKAFSEGFTKLEKAANKYNPHINTSPLKNYLKTHQEKFKGLVDLTPEDRTILRSIQNYMTKRPTELAPLLKNYRKNNQRIKKLIENARITGAQKDLVDYLINVNKEIANSVRETLPKDSAWMKSFDNLNEVYGGYKKALKTQEQLFPLLKGEPTPGKLKALLENPKAIKRLELSMGKEGAKEIQQIAKDLQDTIKAIKKIPVKDLKAMDAIYPLKNILGFNIPIISTIKKGVDVGRLQWGRVLTTPALRKNFDSAVKAISADNIQAYKNATDALKKEQKLIEYKPKS